MNQNAGRSKASVLVTGGAGYIGSILCEHLLAAGYSVTCVDNLMYGGAHLRHLCANPNFDFARLDVGDDIKLDNILCKVCPDVIIPLAAIVGAPACYEYINEAQAASDGIQLMADRIYPSQLVVYPNTNSGYGTVTDGICTEETPLDPISLYGDIKQQHEELLLESHPNTIVLRLATVFGMSPRMRLDLLVNDFVHRAVTDGYLVLYEPHAMRNYVHVRDVADGFIHCIENAEAMKGQPYNLGLDSANCSKLQLAEKIKEHVPGLEIICSEVGEDPDKRNYTVSSERLRRAGFEAKRTLDDGIEELIKGYKMMGRSEFKNV